MKKLLLIVFVLLWFFGFSYGQTSGDNCLSFSDGKLCISLMNRLNGNYLVTKNFQTTQSGKMFTLDCSILLPNGILKEVGTCDKEFSYPLNTTAKVKFYVYFEGERKVIEYDYKFYNPSSTVWIIQKQLYNNWTYIVTTLKNKYPKLKTNTQWNVLTDAFAKNLEDLVYGRPSQFSSEKDFIATFKAFVQYTTQAAK